MKYLDILYRAFTSFRKHTLDAAMCKRFRNVVVNTPSDKDKMEAIRSRCIIEEDWILAIEAGLPHIEKAIMEERQFIRQEGNVVPIEKVKRVSKASVEHLAKHGNLITHVPEEGDDVIPDKLFMVENLNNYAVYENRFLYMLLIYIRDFIDLRYNKIMELNNTYRANMKMTRKIHIGKRNLSYDLTFSEDALNDKEMDFCQACLPLIERIEAIQSIVATLLMTPLMKEVSSAPLLKPPITRTNTLKMNHSFREALALYDYLCAYTKDGYTVETIKKTFSPFPVDLSDELAELIAQTSFLVYEYGTDLKPELKAAYDAEEQRRREEAEQVVRERLEKLKKRIAENGDDPMEYLLLLEDRCKRLDDTLVQNAAFEKQIQTLKEVEADCRRQISELEDACIAHQQALSEAEERHALETQKLQEELRTEMQDLRTELDTHYQEKLTQMQEEKDLIGAERDQCRADLAACEEEKTLAKAELHAVRRMHKMITAEDDFTSKERFNELEREREALEALFQEQWSKTKKKIRKDILWTKSDKDKK